MLRLPGVCLVFSGIVASILPNSVWSAASLLLRNPTLSQDRIAFLYADDIWTVPRQGGEARRLTSVGQVVDGPFFSPMEVSWPIRSATTKSLMFTWPAWMAACRVG